MPEIEIRPAVETDIPYLQALDHHYASEYVWQMDVASEDNLISVRFREVRLPRSVRVDYPRNPAVLEKNWSERAALLVAIHQEQPVGYIALEKNIVPNTAWVTDLVVLRRLRRQGIGSGLLLAGQEWGRHQRLARMVLDM